jgi:hypothetical protein
MRVLCSLLFLLPALLPGATNGLAGRIEEDRYHSPTGEFNLFIPVLPELGGQISDTPAVVTFQDAFNVHASIACFAMDATQRWEFGGRERKDYLAWFFANFVQTDFQQRFPAARIESARYYPSVMNGALLVYNLLPDGTMFNHRVAVTNTDLILVAKRANLVFVHNQHVYVMSIELAERVIQARTWDKTTEEEDELLRQRVFRLLRQMNFRTPAPALDTDSSEPFGD